MNIPNLPFDNLYKFLAIFGLVLVGYSMFFLFSFKENIYLEANTVDKRKSQYNDEIKTLGSPQRTAKHSKDSISIAYDMKLLKRKIDSIPRNLNLFFILTLLGFSCSIFGFLLWYKKLQCYQDEIVKNEATKYSKEHWAYINKTKFNKEHSIYEELWRGLVKLRNETLQLRTDTDEYKDKSLTNEIVKSRSEPFFSAHKNCYELFEHNKPFYAEAIYERVDLVLKLCQSEYVDFAIGGFADLNAYWQKARENSDSIITSIDKVGDSIRLRLDNTEIISKS